MPSFDKLAENFRAEKIEEITINRVDAARGRVRTKTNNGEDLVINLPRGRSIGHGDVFGPSEIGKYFKILIAPEPVIEVFLNKLQTGKPIEDALRLGYNLGNRHLEVLIEDETVFVPVTLGEDKIRKILESMKLPITYETVQKIISMSATGYHPGENEE